LIYPKPCTMPTAYPGRTADWQGHVVCHGLKPMVEVDVRKTGGRRSAGTPIKRAFINPVDGERDRRMWGGLRRLPEHSWRRELVNCNAGHRAALRRRKPGTRGSFQRHGCLHHSARVMTTWKACCSPPVSCHFKKAAAEGVIRDQQGSDGSTTTVMRFQGMAASVEMQATSG
jgi:hypothetical protein